MFFVMEIAKAHIHQAIRYSDLLNIFCVGYGLREIERDTELSAVMPSKGDGEPWFTDTFLPHLAYGSWRKYHSRVSRKRKSAKPVRGEKHSDSPQH